MLDEMDLKILEILPGSIAHCRLPRSASRWCYRPLHAGAASRRWRRQASSSSRVALLDPKSVEAGVTVFVSISTNRHALSWLEEFHRVIVEFPEVVEFYRMSGAVDYLLRVVVPDIAALRCLLQEADLDASSCRTSPRLSRWSRSSAPAPCRYPSRRRRRRAPLAADWPARRAGPPAHSAASRRQ